MCTNKATCKKLYNVNFWLFIQSITLIQQAFTIWPQPSDGYKMKQFYINLEDEFVSTNKVVKIMVYKHQYFAKNMTFLKHNLPTVINKWLATYLRYGYINLLTKWWMKRRLHILTILVSSSCDSTYMRFNKRKFSWVFSKIAERKKSVLKRYNCKQILNNFSPLFRNKF